MARKKAKLAAKAALSKRNWKKRGELFNQVSEALGEGKLKNSVREVANEEAFEENKRKARQNRKHRQTTKEDFSWANTQARKTARKMSIPETQWTWEEGAMAKVGRDISRYYGIPKDAICMILSPPQRDGYIQVLYDGQPFTISAAVLRPMGWVDDED